MPSRPTIPHPLFSAFDAIRIINLAHRTDRRKRMEQQLAGVGLANDVRVSFFAAIATDELAPFRARGSRGCFLSHLALLRAAASAGQSVLILEDDCDFLQNEIADYVLPTGTDVFYGGFVAKDPTDLPQSDIIGSHFMGFSSKAVKIAADYLARYIEPDFPPDPRAAAEPRFDPARRPGIDGAYVWMRRAHPELTTVFCLLGVQRPSRTDIGKRKFYDEIPIVRSIVEAVRLWRASRSQKRDAVFHHGD